MDGQPLGAVRRGAAGVFSDSRGTLTVLAAEEVPFTPRRTYVLHGIPVGAIRGGHANRTQTRLLVLISGRATVILDDGRSVQTIPLCASDSLLIPPAVWHEIEVDEPATVILVFANGDHDSDGQVADRDGLSPAT